VSSILYQLSRIFAGRQVGQNKDSLSVLIVPQYYIPTIVIQQELFENEGNS